MKRPKLYLRDSGLMHTLLAIRSESDLAAHNKLGASWEGFALEVAARAIGKRAEELSFWATHSGAGVDVFWQERGRNWAIEVKYADAPRFTPSMASAVKDLGLDRLWVLYPGDRRWQPAHAGSDRRRDGPPGLRPVQFFYSQFERAPAARLFL